MLKLYDPWDIVIEPTQTRKQRNNLRIYASELAERMGYTNEEELQSGINRALTACKMLHISVSDNFCRIYRTNGHVMISDWKLSALASYLVIVNSDPTRPGVAKAQLFFTFKKRNL